MRTEKSWGKELLMHFETYIGLAAFLYITVVLTVQVLGRYIFKVSWAWIEETSVIGYVILIYCGVSGAVTTRQNMRIDMVLTLVPFMAKKVLMIIDTIIHASFTAWLTYYLWQIIQNMLRQRQVYSVTRFPKVYVYIFMAIMLLLSVLRAVQEVIKLAGEERENLGKAKPAFDLDAIDEEGRQEREAYIAEHPDEPAVIRALARMQDSLKEKEKNKKNRKGGADA